MLRTQFRMADSIKKEHPMDYSPNLGGITMIGGIAGLIHVNAEMESASSIQSEGSTVVHRILGFGMVLFTIMTIILVCVFLQLGNKKKRKRRASPPDAAPGPGVKDPASP